jgi:hypothetical protein
VYNGCSYTIPLILRDKIKEGNCLRTNRQFQPLIRLCPHLLFNLCIAIWKQVKHRNLKFKCPLQHTFNAHCNAGRLNGTSRASSDKNLGKSITDQKRYISNCDANRSFKLFTGVIAAVLWWMRWQLHTYEYGGQWHYLQEQQWPTDRPPGSKRINRQKCVSSYITNKLYHHNCSCDIGYSV